MKAGPHVIRSYIKVLRVDYLISIALLECAGHLGVVQNVVIQSCSTVCHMG